MVELLWVFSPQQPQEVTVSHFLLQKQTCENKLHALICVLQDILYFNALFCFSKKEMLCISRLVALENVSLTAESALKSSWGRAAAALYLNFVTPYSTIITTLYKLCYLGL